MPMTPSPQQQAVLDRVKDPNGGNIVINAVAGSGKTTTLFMLLKELIGEVIMIAFNKSIATELGNRILDFDTDAIVEARTAHSAGMRALMRAQGETLDLRANGSIHRVSFPDKITVHENGRKYPNIIREYIRGFNIGDAEKEYEVTQTLRKLCDLVRLHLVNPADFDALKQLGNHQGLRFLEYRTHVVDIMRIGMRQFREEGYIDFADMMYLPIRFGLPIQKYDWVLVDECQDLSPILRHFARRMGHKDTRYVFVGDPHQAIYGFAGADHESFQRIISEFDATVMDLSTCYRCGKVIVEAAKKIVPQIESREDAIDGEVENIDQEDFVAMVERGDLVLCRLNAPLIQMCLMLIATGEKAAIRGRDLQPMIKGFMKKATKQPNFNWAYVDDALVAEAMDRLNYLNEVNASDSSKAAVIDLYQSVKFVVKALPDGFRQFQFNKKVDEMFSVREDDENAIWLSSIHKAKGLEARRVFLLAPERLPLVYSRQQQHQLDQEYNLKYVALTRAMESFNYVWTPKDEDKLDYMEILESSMGDSGNVESILLES